MKSSLQFYLRSLRNYPVLSREDEQVVARKYKETGRAEYEHKLVESNLRLVVKIANEHRWYRHDVEDLIEQGNLGLIMAVRKFEPERKVRLATYAAFWIRAYILRFIIENYRLVRVGTTIKQRKVLFRLAGERQKGEDGMAERLGMAEDELAVLAAHLHAPELSLDAPAKKQGDDRTTRLELLSSSQHSPEEQVGEADLTHKFGAALNDFEGKLDDRERQLFQARWRGEEQPTLQEIGQGWGVSRERVRQIEQRVLGELRSYLEERRLAA